MKAKNDMQEYFYNIANKVKLLLNVNIDILISDHSKIKGHENAFGCAYSTTGKAKDVFKITIDKDCLKFCYDFKKEFGTKEIIKTLCHEVAHMKYFRHTSRHRELTNKYIEKVRNIA